MKKKEAGLQKYPMKYLSRQETPVRKSVRMDG
jgi:hypothetical protein